MADAEDAKSLEHDAASPPHQLVVTPSPAKKTPKTPKRKREENIAVQIACTTGVTTSVFSGVASETDAKGINNAIVQTTGMCRVVSGSTLLTAFIIGHPVLRSIAVTLEEKSGVNIDNQIFMTVTFGTPSATFLPVMQQSVFPNAMPTIAVPDPKRQKTATGEKKHRKAAGPTSWNIEVNSIMDAQLAAGGKKDLRAASKLASARRSAQKSGKVVPDLPVPSASKRAFGKVAPLGKPTVVTAPAGSMTGTAMSSLLFGQ
jgi:hypothetical protein